jgi:hypothetical protein
VLQQTISKPTGRTSDVGTDVTFRLYVQVPQTSFELVTASTYKSPDVFNGYGTFIAYECASFIADTVIDVNTPGAYQTSC